MSTSCGSAFALVATVAMGCNGLLGLDPVIADRDGDGVPDETDNCPRDANATQRDTDGDGLGNVCDCAVTDTDADLDGVDDACDDCVGPGPMGIDSGGDGVDDGCEPCATATGHDGDGDGLDDACDACLAGPDHDEDGDGLADGCDNCPAQANADQAETDGDALGDACDVVGLTTHTMSFDGFGVRDPKLWPGNVPAWTWVGDGLEATTTTKRYTPLTISGDYLVEGLVGAAPGQSSVLAVVNGVAGTWCTLDPVRGLSLVITGGPVDHLDEQGPVPGTGAMRLRLVSGALATRCQAVDPAGTVIVEATLAQMSRIGRVGVETKGAARFEYLWIAHER